MEMPNDTQKRTCLCLCAGMWLDRWIGQGVGEGYKRGVDGQLMKMKELETVYLRVKGGEDGELHLGNNAKYWRMLEQI